MGNAAVFLFLFISGYGLVHSFEKNGLNGFWDKRIRTVFYPYWLITIVYALLFIPSLNPQRLWINLLCIDYMRSIDGSMWYMSFYLLWMIVFFLVFRMNVPMAFRIVILFLIGWWFLECGREQFQDCAWQFKRNPYSFPLGILTGIISLRVLKGKDIQQRWIQIPVLIGASICFWLLYREQVDSGIRYTSLGILILFILHLFFRLIRINWMDTVLEMIGQSAFMLYLVEGKLFIVIERLLPQSTLPCRFVVFVCLCLLTVALVTLKNKKGHLFPYKKASR